MCRLYAFHANEATKVECPLIYAQNALMAQSMEDTSGGSHEHGWGIATYENSHPEVVRKAWAAYHGEHFEDAATKIYSPTVLAHVRHATVGDPALRNTHPFVYDHWSFAHNGTIPGFKDFKDRMVEEIDQKFRPHIQGETDSEHIFYLFMSQCQRYPEREIFENLRHVVEKIHQWSSLAAPEGKMGLNILVTDGKNLLGSRFGRTLFYTRHEGVYDCEICGFPHVHHTPSVDYLAIDIASEPITHDQWVEIPERSLFYVNESFNLCVEAL